MYCYHSNHLCMISLTLKPNSTVEIITLLWEKLHKESEKNDRIKLNEAYKVWYGIRCTT